MCLAHPIWKSFLRPCTVLSVVNPLIVLNTITFVEVKCIWWVQFLGINKQCHLFHILLTIQNVFRCLAWLMASLQIIFFTCLCAYCFLILSVFQVSFKPNSMISFLKVNILLNSYRKQGKCAILEVKLDTKLRYRSKLCKAIIALVDTAHWCILVPFLFFLKDSNVTKITAIQRAALILRTQIYQSLAPFWAEISLDFQKLTKYKNARVRKVSNQYNRHDVNFSMFWILELTLLINL